MHPGMRDAPLVFAVSGDVSTPPLIIMGAGARRLLVLLALDPAGFGAIAGAELAARCRRRCWPEFRGDPSGGSLRDLLALAERAEAVGCLVLYS